MTDEFWEITNADDAYVQPAIDPALTAEEAERKSDITTDLNTYLAQLYDKYIMGDENIENWDNVIKKLEDMGVRELEQIYNDANARALGQ